MGIAPSGKPFMSRHSRGDALVVVITHLGARLSRKIKLHKSFLNAGQRSRRRTRNAMFLCSLQSATSTLPRNSVLRCTHVVGRTTNHKSHEAHTVMSKALAPSRAKTPEMCRF